MGLGHSPDIFANGLILCLDAGNPKSYPGTGTTWYDIGNNNQSNFTMGGSLTFSSGSFVSTANTSNFFIRNPFNHPINLLTAEMWVLCNIGGSLDALWSYAVPGNDNHQLLYDQSNLSIYGPSGAVSSGISIADGNWKQIVRTSNRSTGEEKLYINGVLRFTTTLAAGTNFSSGGSLVLGQEQDSVGGTFDATQSLEGQYSIFRIYNSILEESQVLKNFNALRRRFGI